MVRVLAVLVSLSLFGLAGCGSSNQAEVDCQHFVSDHYCPAIVSCGYYATVGSCISAVEGYGGLDCSAVHHESGLALCESDVDTASCYYLYTGIPASCIGVFY
jgi:hypothetical protein